jgi:hypothetical protein
VLHSRVCSSVLEECTSPIFKVTESGSSGCCSNWVEEVR